MKCEGSINIHTETDDFIDEHNKVQLRYTGVVDIDINLNIKLYDFKQGVNHKELANAMKVLCEYMEKGREKK